MLTIPRNQDRGGGDYPCDCDICGVRWMRSDMRLTDGGLLACPDEGDGLEAQECLDANSELETVPDITLDKDTGHTHDWASLSGDIPNDHLRDLFVAKYGREPGSELG